YVDARNLYGEALGYKPNDTYSQNQIADCSAKIGAEGPPENERIKALLSKYPPGVTEETIPGDGVVVIKRVLVKGESAYVYEKKIFNWGGVSCFRDGMSITELTFEQETRNE